MKHRYALGTALALLGLILLPAATHAQNPCPATATCQPGGASQPGAGAFGLGIFNVTLGSINNTTNGQADGYKDYSCSIGAAVLSPGLSYPISIRTSPNTEETVRVWADYNGDGTFDPVNELLFASDNVRGLHSGTTRIVPATARQNVPLRLRVAADAAISPVPGPCTTPQYSQVEDYQLLVQPNTQPPTAQFSVDAAQACSGQFSFRDESLLGATSWQWEFGDGTTSTQQNPNHTYATPGAYTVTLRACNANGCTTTRVPTNQVPVAFYATNPAAPLARPATLTYCCGYGLTRVELGEDPARNGAAPVDQPSADGRAGYQDFACVQRLTLPQNAPLPVRLTGTPTLAQTFRLFLDTNNDGAFTANELLWERAGVSEVRTYLGLPATVPTGVPLRLRIIADASDGPADANASRTRGQVEDYSLVLQPVACTGSVRAGQIVAVEQTPDSQTNLRRTIYTLFNYSANASLQWQRQVVGQPWEDVAGATQPQLTADDPLFGGSVSYRVQVRCGAASQLTAAVQRGNDYGYRLQTACQYNSDYIQSVRLAGTTLNSESACNDGQGNGYSLYSTAEVTRNATLYQKESYALTVKTSGAGRVTVFGSWFNAFGQCGMLRPIMTSTTGTTSVSVVLNLDSVNLTVPTNTTGPVLRLRVRFDMRVGDTSVPDEYDNLGLGETEDYVLRVVPRTCFTTVVAGRVLAVPAQCPTDRLLLTAVDYTPGAQLQWQFSADSLGWQDLAGQTRRELTLPDSRPGWYRVRVAGCSAPAYSVPARLRLRDYTTCYCSLTAYTQAAAAPRLARVQLRGTTLDNAANPAAPLTYAVYPPTGPARTATLVRGATYALDLTLATTAGSPVTAQAWLDLDHNGRYDSLEWVHLKRLETPGTGSAVYRAELPVSTRALPGLTGLRLRVNAGLAWRPGQACASYQNGTDGETHDYLVTLQDAPCTAAGLPLSAGIIEWPQPASCVSLLRSRGYSLGATLQWQQAPALTGPWTDLPGATLEQVLLPTRTRPAAVSYRLRARCGTSDAYTTPVTVPAGTCNAFSSTFSCVDDNIGPDVGSLNVEDVVLTGTSLASYSSRVFWVRGYNAHLRRPVELPSYTATLTRGATHTLQITTATQPGLPAQAGVVGAWMDWNHDNLLTAGEFLGSFAVPATRTTMSFAVTVPATADLGSTLLRVRTQDGATTFGSPDGCYYWGLATGETEDYLLTVVAQSGPALPTLTASRCTGSTVELAATGAGSGATVTWLGPNGYTATGATATVPGFTPALAGTYVALAERNGQRIATSIYVPENPSCGPLAARASLAAGILTVYPNPTTGQTTLTWPTELRASRVLVRAVTGQVVLDRSVTGGTSLPLDLHALPTGLYLVELQTQQGTAFTKLVRE